MRSVLLICLLTFINILNSQEEYVTLWTPNKFYDEKDYNVVLLSNDIDKRTEIGLQFRKSYGTVTLATEKVQKITVKNINKSGAKKNFELFMTLHRNESTSTGTRHMCMTETIHNIEAEKRQFYTFIQTDKTIYKPSDTVRFRVVVVDRDLRPYHMNNININVIDPLNRPIKRFDDLGENFNGVFAGKFDLSIHTHLGIWKIEVVVDKIEQWLMSKEFAVSKYNLHPFTANLLIKNEHLLLNSILQISLFGENLFHEFVSGHAQLTIMCTTTNKMVYNRTFNDVSSTKQVKLRVYEDLKANPKINFDYEYEVKLGITESNSNITNNKTSKFYVHLNQNDKIVAKHPSTFYPGHSFSIKIYIYNWKQMPIESSSEKVKTACDFQLENGEKKSILVDAIIKRGISEINLVVPENSTSFFVRITYLDAVYENNVQKGSVYIGNNKIIVDYLPKSPEIGDSILIYATTEMKIDQLVIIVISRLGIIETHQIYCNYFYTCTFNITFQKEMMPSAKMKVYFIKDKQTMYQGETIITSGELGKNTLNIKLPTKAEANRKVDLKISTRPDSTVYLLVFDKRLSYLFQGNEIKNDDVVKEMADYDDHNKITVFDMNKTNWHECDSKELKRIALGRSNGVDHGGDEFTANEDEDEDDDEDEDLEGDLESERNESETSTASVDDIYEDFREVWLYEEFEVPDGKLTQTFITPVSITTWMVSSFSMNSEYGLAIGPPTELVVKNQFFTKIFLPYSIRFKEKLRVDVIVFNYVETKEALDVKVTIFHADNEITIKRKNSFKVFDNEFSSTPNDDTKSSQTVKVPHENTRKVSFYIQAGSDRREYEEIIRIRVHTTATTRHGEKFEDKILKRLRVEPVGVKTYDIEFKSHNLKNETRTDSVSKNVTGSDEYPKFIVEIAGDYLTDDMSNVKLGYELYPDYSLEQRISVLKGNVEHFRYLKFKNTNPVTTHFSSYYQSILDQKAGSLNYAPSSGYRAYFIEAIASAMELGAIPVNKVIIEKEFDALKSQQTANGNFNNFGNIPDGKSEYFRTAYILIPFLKFKKFVTKNYDDVINKGFAYLSGIHAVSGSDKEAYSAAAFAYSLNNQNDQAENMMNEVEKDVVRIDNHRRCYKISKSQSKCDRRHTSYAAIAYLQMKKHNKAKALITYIIGEYKLLKEYRYTYAYAISTEAISKFLIAYPISRATDFKVTLSNEMDFNKVVHITTANQKDPVEVVFPDYTLNPKMIIKGSGYCSLTKIMESTVNTTKTSSKFDLTVNTLQGSLSYEGIVQVCATYQPQDDKSSKQTLFNVIYDVEMPSGYIYKEIVNMASKPEIKLATLRLDRTRVQIYYNDFEQSKEYCAEIKATKFFDVKDVQNAGVMVYDCNDKKNIAIDFYKFSSNC